MRKLVVILVTLLFALNTRASHMIGGEITYVHLAGDTYQVTITTYTNSNASGDRCELEISWGDGDSDTLVRSNGTLNTVCGVNVGEGEMITGNIRLNIYIGTHTYPGPGIYRISLQDGNRAPDIINMQDSFNTPFVIATTLFHAPVFSPANNSIFFTEPPVFTD